MSQETNLNVSPYFDDFDATDNYYKVLFKPGYPIQSRELTTSQSILQNQIEQFGNHIFKEGSVVIPGGISYNNSFNAVELQASHNGISVVSYLPKILGNTIRGKFTGIRARIVGILDLTNSERGNNTLYVNYLSSDTLTGSLQTFADNEDLVIEQDLSTNSSLNSNTKLFFSANDTIATTIPRSCASIGSIVTLYEGIYFIRGYFVKIKEQTIPLKQYGNDPSYKVGLRINEEIITSIDNDELNDNAKGFLNFSAPGADRFKITAELIAIALNNQENIDSKNFIQLLQIENGIIRSETKNPKYNELLQEFARRTYDESGDYYVNSPSLAIKETLNNLKGNGGVFSTQQKTYNDNVPSEELGTYSLSPLKATVKGFSVETISPTYLDFKKPRTTKTLTNQSINYYTGPTYRLNRVSGSPILGISTSYTVSLRDSRVGVSSTTSPGKEIGLARVYDFGLETGSYSATNQNLNEWDISLYDVQTYTEISLNEPITLTAPTHIKGKSSGAIGFLKYSTTSSGIITAYNTKGQFAVGEKFVFDGIENTRVSTAITSYSTSDIKSLYGIVGSASTFTADIKQTSAYNIGLVNITPISSGISTVTTTQDIFINIATVGNLVSYSNPGLSTVSYAKIQNVTKNKLTIVGITTVSGICDGALPTTTINPNDFKILSSNLLSSSDNTLYTLLPKRNIASVDFTGSELTIKRQFDVTITSNSTGVISTGDLNQTFLPYVQERYSLIRSDGTTEPLSSDKFVFTSGSQELTIIGLSGNGPAKLIATIRKTNIKSKVKNKNRVKTLIVDKSKYNGSGIGSTTFNDGLSYGTYPYGTRVQDDIICLLEPDITNIYAIYESNDTSNPDIPNLTLTSINSPTSKTGDLIIGEEFVGKTSGAVGIYVERVNDFKINFVNLNANRFLNDETIKFKESSATAVIQIADRGDIEITNNFTFDNGQRESIYDYSRIIRKKNIQEPTKKIKIIFESASFSSSDTGDLTTINSYQQFDYSDLPLINGTSNSDILDIRPRVSNFSVTTSSLSPFEFSARTFSAAGNSASNILASNESILFDYSFYLPRIDKIFVNKDATFQVVNGQPAENPQKPTTLEDSLEIATIVLPAYLPDINKANITLTEHKRYRMSDIKKLEDRIQNLEYYTSLSLLESNTSNLQITDINGLNRFKSGFFVDDFSTTKSQIKITGVKNSIDVKNSELRPSPYTTSIDLVIGSASLLGIGTISNPDASQVVDIIGNGIARTGPLITLDYTEVAEITNPYATRVENVAPYRVAFYAGTMELTPSSDVWVDTVRLTSNTINVLQNYMESESQIKISDADKQTGFGPVSWGSWETSWTGEQSSTSTQQITDGSDYFDQTILTSTKIGTNTRQGTRNATKEIPGSTVSLGDRVLSTDIISFMRSRNIEFISKRMKPLTRVYGFLDGVDVNKYLAPKLIEITMSSGVFSVGETVIGSVNDSAQTLGSEAQIKFRVAQQNHKQGAFDLPVDVYDLNPYSPSTRIPQSYSATSSILNVDTFSLSNQTDGTFFGYIQKGMKLRGNTSGAEAIVSDVRLFTDNCGTVIGSLYIPNPNIKTNPSFTTGTKVFKLTSSSLNSQVSGEVFTTADEKYHAEGKKNTVQENIISPRTVRTETQIITDSQAISTTNSTVVSVTPIGKISPTPDPIPQPTPSGGDGAGGGPGAGGDAGGGVEPQVQAPDPPAKPVDLNDYFITKNVNTGALSFVQVPVIETAKLLAGGYINAAQAAQFGPTTNFVQFEGTKGPKGNPGPLQAEKIFESLGVNVDANALDLSGKIDGAGLVNQPAQEYTKNEFRFIEGTNINSYLVAQGLDPGKLITNTNLTIGSNMEERTVGAGKLVGVDKDGFVGGQAVGTTLTIEGTNAIIDSSKGLIVVANADTPGASGNQVIAAIAGNKNATPQAKVEIAQAQAAAAIVKSGEAQTNDSAVAPKPEKTVTIAIRYHTYIEVPAPPRTVTKHNV